MDRGILGRNDWCRPRGVHRPQHVELFPAAEDAWRVPTLLLFSGSGMATGGWLAGFLYDRFRFYGVAFGTGLMVNLGNLIIIGALVLRELRMSGGISTAPRPFGS